MMTRIVLASNSPRRKQLLAIGGWDFDVQPADVDESPLSGENPRDYTLRLAKEKARVVASQHPEDVLIIASDTTVADKGDILGKPIDEADAAVILTRLRGRKHKVFTAVAVSFQGNIYSEIAETNVDMRQYSDDEMTDYIDSGDPLDKAGAYAIQHADFHPVAQTTGCYANVMGLPICHLARLLSKLGIAHNPELPTDCQITLNHICLVYEDILSN